MWLSSSGISLRPLVVPALNEEESLPYTLSDIHRAVPDMPILVVDDGSTDNTVSAASN